MLYQNRKTKKIRGPQLATALAAGCITIVIRGLLIGLAAYLLDIPFNLLVFVFAFAVISTFRVDPS